MPSRDEFSLIDWIRQHAQIREPVATGIGDDTAIVNGPAGGRQVLVTTDMLMEGRHFRLETATPQQIGRKALGVNLSDIAAMAGRPTAAFISLALPQSGGRRLAEGLYEGMNELAERYEVSIAGGDTNAWDGPLVLNVTLLGESSAKGPVRRAGARPGDRLFVTGPVGGSLPSGRHLAFEPRLREAALLHERFDLHALIDLSDGISSDLGHIATESGVRAVLIADQIPVHADVDPALPAEERLRHALSDGEDFELLLAVGPEEADRMRNSPDLAWLTEVGRVEAGEGCWIQDRSGRVSPLEAAGWVHRFD